MQYEEFYPCCEQELDFCESQIDVKFQDFRFTKDFDQSCISCKFMGYKIAKIYPFTINKRIE